MICSEMLDTEVIIPNKGKGKMKIPTHQDFIKYVTDHLEKSGEKPSAFGRRVLGDSAAITRLETTDPRLSTMQKIVTAINTSKK